jgi:hypothetical protein
MMLRSLLVIIFIAPTAAAGDIAELSAITAGLPPCDPGRTHCFAIRLHVAVVDGKPITTPQWVATQLTTVNRMFEPLDVAFQVVATDGQSIAHVKTRQDRNDLAAHIGGTVIDVFITGQLDDVDVPGEIARGVTWRKGSHKFVIISTVAPDRVLAHELGHLFGLPHSTYAISIMNKTPRDEPPLEQRRFADEEIARLQAGLSKLLRSKRLVTLDRPTARD